jgi:hypothetical protein
MCPVFICDAHFVRKSAEPTDCGCSSTSQEQCRQFYSDARLDLIRDKVPVQMRIEEPIPVQMMADNNLPTEEEKTAIIAWAEQRQLCQQASNALLGAQPTHVEAIRSANSQAMADLYAGRISFGEFAKQLNQNRIAFFQQDQALRAQAQRDSLQAQQVLQQHLYQQQQLNLQQQQINNERLRSSQPSSVNCTTQYIGNQAYTHCN